MVSTHSHLLKPAGWGVSSARSDGIRYTSSCVSSKQKVSIYITRLTLSVNMLRLDLPLITKNLLITASSISKHDQNEEKHSTSRKETMTAWARFVHHNFSNPWLANPIIAACTDLHLAQLLDFSTLVTTALYFSQRLKSFDSQ